MSVRVSVRISARLSGSVIPIYGHMTMYYTHIWSYDRVLYPYMVIRPCIICVRISARLSVILATGLGL